MPPFCFSFPPLNHLCDRMPFCELLVQAYFEVGIQNTKADVHNMFAYCLVYNSRYVYNSQYVYNTRYVCNTHLYPNFCVFFVWYTCVSKITLGMVLHTSIHKRDTKIPNSVFGANSCKFTKTTKNTHLYTNFLNVPVPS